MLKPLCVELWASSSTYKRDWVNLYMTTRKYPWIMPILGQIFTRTREYREMFHNARSLHCVISFTMFHLPVCELLHNVQWICLWCISQSRLASVWWISQCLTWWIVIVFTKSPSFDCVILFTKSGVVCGVSAGVWGVRRWCGAGWWGGCAVGGVVCVMVGTLLTVWDAKSAYPCFHEIAMWSPVLVFFLLLRCRYTLKWSSWTRICVPVTGVTGV